MPLTPWPSSISRSLQDEIGQQMMAAVRDANLLRHNHPAMRYGWPNTLHEVRSSCIGTVVGYWCLLTVLVVYKSECLLCTVIVHCTPWSCLLLLVCAAYKIPDPHILVGSGAHLPYH